MNEEGKISIIDGQFFKDVIITLEKIEKENIILTNNSDRNVTIIIPPGGKLIVREKEK